MPKTIKIDSDRLREAFKGRGYGSGSVCYAAGIPNNALQRILGRGYGFEEEVEALAETLGTKKFYVQHDEDVLSIRDTQATINGAEDPLAEAEKYFAEELKSKIPRKSLLKWFADEYQLRVPAAGSEAAEAPVEASDEVLSVAKTQEAISEADDPEAAAAEYFEKEMKSESPRKTLLSWLKEEYDLGEEE